MVTDGWSQPYLLNFELIFNFVESEGSGPSDRRERGGRSECEPSLLSLSLRCVLRARTEDQEARSSALGTFFKMAFDDLQ